MRIAVAREGDMVSEHFGHCEQFVLFDVEGTNVTNMTTVDNPGHQPGFLPGFLKDKGVDVVIAGGMGPKAVELFQSLGIKTITGVRGSIRGAVEAYVAGELKGTGEVCDHHGGHDCEHR
ncbi:MAG TPA: dinitrogenase iron-molybdenum cofactor [Syntrophothermus lipocalidus]|uniref:Dinitrogenase iron-molybdenum cofactor biosynthesis protein n=1 Tax=Syntrophothermus lipocalidus (strain DSM 12680 / TGB-C1) TaxID=643648 RepID=D7CK08_SYNLT|nr:NifB/NifX family molybdenum-iron cluster-binding protein [Syntrophothermus lipocalidus]ADI01122.1 Dinitrogenase iron-molybdenum cofactor biosynthesis protein [Syntrophothermus lipocalidus DSM 12680]HHV77951.1 dinitrogenase iron-molybdenum cofactor [Syntrophothermus lipocalidus]HOV43203.1 NifB/NifX family molybdenum-iron cluster-binding protein [Syntrophothermus lipocalidus]